MATNNKRSYTLFATMFFIQICTVFQGVILAEYWGLTEEVNMPRLLSGLTYCWNRYPRRKHGLLPDRAGRLKIASNIIRVALLAVFLTSSITTAAACFSAYLFFLSASVKRFIARRLYCFVLYST